MRCAASPTPAAGLCGNAELLPYRQLAHERRCLSVDIVQWMCGAVIVYPVLDTVYGQAMGDIFGGRR